MNRAEKSAERNRVLDQPELQARLDRFETALFAGQNPLIEDFVQSDLPQRLILLEELVHLEIEYRGKQGFPFELNDYRDRFPSLVQNADCLNRLQETYRKWVSAAARPRTLDTLEDANGPATDNGPRTPFLANEQLLFGIIALQTSFITREQLLAAFDSWVHDKSRTIAEILEDQGALPAVQREAIEKLVAMFVEKHGGAAEQSLAALTSVAEVRRDLERLNDPDLEASLGHMGANGNTDPHLQPTLTFTSSSRGRFRILRPHAKGGLGQVSVALDQDLNREVALKEIQPKHADDQISRERFVLEAEITGGLEHPGIVPVYALGQDGNGRPFYAMRFVKGDSLKEAIEHFHKRDNPNRNDAGARQLELHQLLGRFIDVCNAVEYAHNRGVLHRDLKPGNIMVGKYGETLVVDWGLAKVGGKKEIVSDEATLRPTSALSSSGQTQPGSAIGTPAYMSPEQAAGKLDELGPASDVYSLGATLYHVLCGKPPFEKEDLAEIMAKVQRGDFPPPRSVVPEVSTEFEAICLKAMATNPADRYPTVRALADDLESCLAGSPVSGILSSKGRAALDRALKSGDYNDFAIALTSFDQAVQLWQDSVTAREGLDETRLAYAECAFQKGDYALGLSVVDNRDPSHKSIITKLLAAQQSLESRQKRLTTMRRVIAAIIALLLIGLTVATISINNERSNAVAAQKKENEAKIAAQESEQKAIDAAKEEEKAKIAAQDSEKKAIDAAKLEERAKIAALESEYKAKKAAEDEAMARMDADAKRKEADAQRLIAQENEKKAVVAKAAQDYEAYVAQIGLAASRIEENSFESALNLLQECKPELRNWEWGRLMYLCGLSIKTADSKAPIDAVAFSPDGSQFITGGWNRTAKIWDTATAQEKRSLPVVGLFVHAVAWSNDGKVIATAGNDKRVRLWNAATGEAIKTEGEFAGHTDGVLSVVFSRDGSKLLTASNDKTARLWDAKTGKELRVLKGHSWWVWSAVFSPDETQVVTASQDGSAIVWDLKSSATSLPLRFLEHTGPVYTAAFSPDGQFVATGGYDTKILVWRPNDVKALDLARLAKDEKQEHVPFRSLEGHGGPVRSVSFSIDGSLVLSGSHDNTVKIWDAESGRTVKTLRGHASWVRACAFSPDRRTILSAGHDNVAKRWNITDYEEVRVLQGRVLRGNGDAVLAVSFNPDGTNLVTASRDRTARTWDFRTGGELRVFAEGYDFLPSNAAFFPDGKRLFTAAVDNTVRLWDVESGTQISRFDNTGRSAALALSPDGERILTGGYKRTSADNKVEWVAQVWDVKANKVVRVLEGHKYEVTSVAISPDGKWLFTGDANGRGILWNATTYAAVHKLQSHTGKITAAVFLQDNSRLLTASTDHTVGQWDVQSGNELLPLVLKHPDSVLSVAFVPGSRHAVTCCGDNLVRIWNIDQATVAGNLPKPDQGTINRVAVSADATQLLTVNPREKSVRLWDLTKRRELPPSAGRNGALIDFNRVRGQLWNALFAPEDKSILTIGGSEARLWDVKRGTELISFSSNGIATAAGFSPDGTRVVTGSWDNAARVWDARTGAALLKLEGHVSFVNSAVYSPDGSLILTASDDKSAILWESQTGRMIRELKGHNDRVRSAVFSPDGKQVLTASNDSTARLWNSETGAEVGIFAGHDFAVMSAVFSTDGKKVLTGGEDKTARIWDVETFKELLPAPLAGHTASVASVAFLPDGKRVLTGSLDYTAKLWDAETGKEMLTLKGHTREVTCVGVSTNGRYVVTGSSDGTAVVWLSTDWKQQALP